MLMKKTLGKRLGSIFLGLTMALTIGSSFGISASAAEGILIDDTNFHDEQFRKYLIESDFNADHDTILTDVEIANATSVTLTDDYNITDLYGLDKLTQLEELMLYSHSLKNVDLSVVPWIQYFYACDTGLETLNLSGCTSLNSLEIYGNNLSSLDLTDCTSLSYLVCNDNNLQSLDISNTALLQDSTVPYLGSQKNGLQIKVNMTTAQRLMFDKLPKNEYNQNIVVTDPSRPDGFVVIDDTNFPDETLRNIILSIKADQNSDNMLSAEEIAAVKTLDLSGTAISNTTGLEVFTELETLIYDNAGLTSLDASPFKKLKKLSIKDNSLTYIVLDQNTLLEELYCDNNELKYLDLTNNKNLVSLTCCDNVIDELDISNTKVATNASGKCVLGYANKERMITIIMNDAQTSFFYGNIVTKNNTAGNKGIINHPHDDRLLNTVEQIDSTEVQYGVKKHFVCSYCGSLFEDIEGMHKIDDFKTWKDGDGRVDYAPVITLQVPIPIAGKEAKFPVFATSKDIHLISTWVESSTELLYPSPEYSEFAKVAMNIDLKEDGYTFDTFEAGKNYEFVFLARGNDLPKTDHITALVNDQLISLDWSKDMNGFSSNSSDLVFLCEDTHVHSLKTVVTTKATLTKNGLKEIKCTTCGETTKSATIYAAKTIQLSTTNYTYNGNVKKPSVTIKDSKGNTISSTNYTITYPAGRKIVGTYTVNVKFKGNYTGSKNLTFTINPPKTSILSLTPGSQSFVAKWEKKTSQVTGYQLQYSTTSDFSSGKKTVTITSNQTAGKTIKSLNPSKKYYVRIRTYKTVGDKKYYSGWSVKKAVTTKK